MKGSRFSEEQIIGILREHKAGAKAGICRRHGISDATFYIMDGLPPSTPLSVKDIYERFRDDESFLGGYSTVSAYLRPAARDEDCILEQAYDLLISRREEAPARLFIPAFSPRSTRVITRRARSRRARATSQLLKITI